MKAKDKKEIISVIVETMKKNAVKDMMNGLLTYAWTDKRTNPYSIYTTAENVFTALNIEKLLDGKVKDI